LKPLPDGLRRAYSVYRLGHAPAGALAKEMGMSAKMLDRYIQRCCTPAAATRYWRIYP
jgi:hypothetical protein